MGWFAACSDPGVTPPPGPPPADDALDADALVERALGFLEGHVDPATHGDVRGYDVLRVFSDERGLGHVHLQQRVDGVPVFGGQVIVHLRDDGAVRAVTDDLQAVGALPLAPALDADDALAAAGGPGPSPDADPDADFALPPPPPPELWVLHHEGAEHLVWSVQLADLGAEEPTLPRVFVDAHDGSEVWRYDQLQTVQITNATRYDGNRVLDVYDTGAVKYLEDPVRDFVTATFNNTTGSLFYVATSAATFADTTAAQLHFATAQVDDYYGAVHGRDGIDGSGGPGFVPRAETGADALTGAAHFGFRYNNAFWDPVNGLFAAGDGGFGVFSPLVSVDVVGHEFTHGVTQYTANLTYAGESGALNESASDVFGAAVEARMDGAVSAATWRIGEDCYTPSTAGDALRYLDDPTADGSSLDHYADRYVGALDNGGVHWNSGIGNLAFYLVSQGGNHPTYGGTPVTGLGLSDAERIWYLAHTTYATASTGFHGMRVATLLAAEDLFGVDSPETAVVDDAWALVGVTPWVLQGSGWASGGVGAPAVVYRKPTGQVVMAFESRTSPPSEQCPNGQWSIGLATSTDGRTFTQQGAAILGPTGSGWRSCVVAHPTLVVDEAGTGLHLWFKAETDTAACGDDAECLYSGIGYAHVRADLTAVDTVSTGPVLDTAQVMGFPSVVQVGGAWQMSLQSGPEVFLATAPAASGPWALQPGPALEPGVTSWAADEVFNPALVCEGDTSLPARPFSNYFGGRGLDAGLVADGGLGHAISADGSSWLMGTETLYAFEGNERWRHWSAVRHGSGVVFYYSETVGGVNRIGVRTRLTSWSPAGMAPRTCPAPSWW